MTRYPTYGLRASQTRPVAAPRHLPSLAGPTAPGHTRGASPGKAERRNGDGRDRGSGAGGGVGGLPPGVARPPGDAPRPGGLPAPQGVRRLDRRGVGRGPGRLGPLPRRARAGGRGARGPRREPRRVAAGRDERGAPLAPGLLHPAPGVRRSPPEESASRRLHLREGGRPRPAPRAPRTTGRLRSRDRRPRRLRRTGQLRGPPRVLDGRRGGARPVVGQDGAPLRRRRVPARLRLGLPGGARRRAGPLQPRRGPVEGGQPRPGTERRRLLGEVPGREPDGARPRAARRGQGAPAGPPRGGGRVARTGCRGAESSGSETPPTSPTP